VFSVSSLEDLEKQGNVENQRSGQRAEWPKVCNKAAGNAGPCSFGFHRIFRDFGTVFLAT
jgi:hypothetical protein